MNDTPLGKIIEIRSETDKEVIKKFTPDQKRIRNEWLNKNAIKIDSKNYKEAMNGFLAMFKSMA